MSGESNPLLSIDLPNPKTMVHELSQGLKFEDKKESKSNPVSQAGSPSVDYAKNNTVNRLFVINWYDLITLAHIL